MDNWSLFIYLDKRAVVATRGSATVLAYPYAAHS